jgi:hypothetical protein
MTDKRGKIIRWRVEMRRERGAKQRLFLQSRWVYLAGKGAGERVLDTPGRDIEAAMATTILCAARPSEVKRKALGILGGRRLLDAVARGLYMMEIMRIA